MKKLLTPLLLTLLTLAYAQHKRVVHNYTEIKPVDWVIPHNDTVSYAFGQHQGQKALLMKRKYGNYKAGTVIYPKKLVFKNGIIEADLAFPGDGNGFVGIAFRIKDAHHYETVYFRPGSSGTINAIQYMPEKKADFNWYDYEADKYQAKATLPAHGWFHVKAVVQGNTVAVFVNNESKPSMIYKPLDNSLSVGSAGFWFGNSTEDAFKNLVVTCY